MKGGFKNVFLNKWSDIMSKLSNPVTTKHRFFSYEAAQLVFILIVFFIISDFTNFIEFSQTILGRISVIIVLLYFTAIHPMIGAKICWVAILFYNSDLIKSYYYDSHLYKNTPSTIQEQLNYKTKSNPDYISNIMFRSQPENFQNMEASTINSAYPFTTDVRTITSKHSPSFQSNYFNETEIREGFQSSSHSHYKPTYDLPIHSDVPYSMRQTEISYDSKNAEEEAHKNALFRKEHCSINGELIHKNSVIKPSMAEFIYPDLQIEGSQDGHGCNPCDPNCNIHISKFDQRLNNENILHRRNTESLQKTSSDWVPTWFDIFLPHPFYQKYDSKNSQPFAEPANK